MSRPIWLTYFDDLPDPRVRRTRKRLPTDILLIVLVGTICECRGWDDMRELIADGPAELRALFDLPHGVPCADTLRRVIGAIDPAAFRTCFTAWSSALCKSTEGKPVANSHATSQISGWVMGLAAETEVFYAPIRNTIIVASAAGGVAILLTLLLALWAARRIAHPIQQIERGTHALGRREAVAYRPTGLPEVDRALDAFTETAKVLEQHERERDEREPHLAVLPDDDALDVGEDAVPGLLDLRHRLPRGRAGADGSAPDGGPAAGVPILDHSTVRAVARAAGH